MGAGLGLNLTRALRKTARLIVCLTFLLVSCATLAGAQELVLKPDEPRSGVESFTRYLEDPRHALTIEEAIAADHAGRFSALPDGKIDFGFTDAMVWLKIPVRNGASTPRQSVLAFNVTFMHRIDAWLVTEKGADRILHQTQETPFPTRPTTDLRLAAPFTLESNQTGALYVSYWSAGGTAMPITIETPKSFAERRAATDSIHAAFYSVIGVLVLFSLLLWGAMRRPLFLLYGVHITSVLLFLMHGDGVTFRYLWPYWPEWNVIASLPLGLAMNITAGFFTRGFLDTARKYPLIDKAFLTIMAVSALTILAGFAGFERAAKMTAFPLVVAASLVYLVGGVRALEDGAPGSLYYVIGWTSISIAAGVALAVTTPLLPGSNEVTYDLVRGGIVFDSLMMAIALMVQAAKIRAERDALVKRELGTMHANMDLIHRMNALEQRHALAEAAAEASGRTLASAFHDMRQPLLSLRLAVQRLSREPAAARDAQQLEASLAYLETLADTLLTEEHGLERAQSDRTPSGAPGAEGAAAGDVVESFQAQLVLDALEQMFARDAREKGLRFACVRTSATLSAPPLALVRILSNLVANAVRNTKKGGVALGCRRRAGRIWLCVYDTGPGLTPEQHDRVVQVEADVVQNQEGRAKGLGLSIVRRLAGEHDLQIEIRTAPGKGSAFAVAVPPA
jgi:signal transduction histidine kinase